MIIQGARLQGGRYLDQPTSLVQCMDAADYSGSGTTWPARVGASGTLINAPAYSTSNGGYFTFDPASLQYALFPNIGDLGTWTVECWFQLTASLATKEATAAVTTIYDNGTGTNYGQINYTLSSYNGGSYNSTMTAGYFNGTWHTTSGIAPTVGQWYQAVGTFDGTTLKNYINGSLYASAAGGGASSANGAPIRVARRWDGPESSIHYFPGKIAIVKIYNSALNSSQVSQQFNSTCSRFGLAPNLVTDGLIMNLDAGNTDSYSGTGTTWYDLSNAGNNATLTGSTPWTSAGNQSYFTFASGYAGAGTILPNSAYTKVGIFRVPGSYVNLISGDDANMHAFWGAATPYLQSGHNGVWNTVVSPVVTPANQWVFGAVSFSNTTGWRLYLNNNSVVTNPDTTQFSANPALVEIGAYAEGNNLGGDVATALVYNRVLTDAEIAQNFAYYQTRFGL